MTACACGYATVAVPTTRDEALELARRRPAQEELLEQIVLDSSRWLGIFRCRACGGLWVEDSLSTGPMDLLFVYPLRPLNV